MDRNYICYRTKKMGGEVWTTRHLITRDSPTRLVLDAIEKELDIQIFCVVPYTGGLNDGGPDYWTHEYNNW